MSFEEIHVLIWECGWGVSSRDGSRWKSVEVIGSQEQQVFCGLRESLGAQLGSEVLAHLGFRNFTRQNGNFADTI